VRVLVTGATGFVGREVARQLADRGSSPRLMVRRPTRSPYLDGLAGERVHADLRVPDTLRAAVEGCDTVIHLAGRATFEPAKHLVPTFVDGTRALASAAIDAGVRRFVFASSVMVHGSTSVPITAATPPAPEVDYGRVKLDVERELAAMGTSSGMAVASIRLPHVYGNGDLLLSRLRPGRVIVPGPGVHPYAHLHVHDAARVLIAAAAVGYEGASVIADRESAPLGALLDEIARRLPDARIHRAPAWMAAIGVRAIRAVSLGSGRLPSVYTTDTVHAWNMSLPVDPDALWSDLGITPDLPTYREGIARALDDVVEHGWRPPVHDRRRV
jgi:nucleoside-diphosphate-sugar epimerase